MSTGRSGIGAALLALVVGVLIAAVPGHAQQPTPGCSDKPGFKDFDFWVGEWDVYSNDSARNLQGRNVITYHHADCLIKEQWRGAGGSTGTSLNYYNPITKRWRQLWVSAGYAIDYSGGLTEAGEMRLEGTLENYTSGTSVPFRGIWTPREDGTVVQHFDLFDQESGQWQVWFEGLYVRRTSADDDLATFVDWFPGRYDSSLQLARQRAAGLPADDINYRRHSVFRRIDLPAFGDVVYYAEQYRDGDPQKIYRQRIYSVSIDTARDALRLRVHIPPEPSALRGAYRQPSLLAGLTPDQMTVWPGCDLYWHRKGEVLVGKLDQGSCTFRSEQYGDVVLEEALILHKDALWFADRGTDPAGNYLFGMKGETPTKAIKARSFSCATNDTTGQEQTVLLHDQGGRAVFKDGLMLTLDRLVDRIRVRARAPDDDVVHTAFSETDTVDSPVVLQLDGRQISCRLAPDAAYEY